MMYFSSQTYYTVIGVVVCLLQDICLDVYGWNVCSNTVPTLRRRPSIRLWSYSCRTLPEEDVEKICASGGPKAHVYGEMTVLGLRELMTEISVKENDVFLDLGSGSGELVIQAAQEFGQIALGIELSKSRHEEALRNLASIPSSQPQPRVTFVCGDAAGIDAQQLLSSTKSPPTIVWCSNLLFDRNLQGRIADTIGSYGTNVRAVASLTSFPNGIPGMTLHTNNRHIEMSWTVNKQQAGHPPLPGHPCSIYYSSSPK
uniref:Histone-lysine N-methyltransferase, H3 lysine-79 specific n=1 Tax=Eucampia antarctica TaxID=49252 RepID=A0A7S2VZ20_9STRA|mmetsp:Transcript_11037/g.10565  ORF Transcript_11037/g.10565 Transcript_11037/m.10565 type:complete len:257 (+) Transcript_11037:127-897(+)